jgi:hypothetical protein
MSDSRNVSCCSLSIISMQSLAPRTGRRSPSAPTTRPLLPP